MSRKHAAQKTVATGHAGRVLRHHHRGAHHARGGALSAAVFREKLRA